MKIKKYLLLKFIVVNLIITDIYCGDYKKTAFEDIKAEFKKASNSENTKNNVLNQKKKEDYRIAQDLLKHAVRYQMSKREEVNLDEHISEKKITLNFKCPIPKKFNRIPVNVEDIFGIGSKPNCEKNDLQCALAWAQLRRMYGPENEIFNQGSVVTFGTKDDEIEVFIKLEFPNDIHGYISAKKELYEKIKKAVSKENEQEK